MYVCMYVLCIYLCVYVCMRVCTYYVFMYVCMYVLCVYVCIYVCMYVRMAGAAFSHELINTQKFLSINPKIPLLVPLIFV
jgi:hypothetical protein